MRYFVATWSYFRRRSVVLIYKLQASLLNINIKFPAKLNNGQSPQNSTSLDTFSLNSAEPKSEEKEFEDKLMDIIDNGGFEDIEQNITPQAFQKCKSNSLEMGMKVRTSLSCSLWLDIFET